MGDSLRDQLLKSGAATKKQAKAVAVEVRQEARLKRKATQSGLAPEEQPSDGVRLKEAQSSQRARDRELNREREETRRLKEVEAQVRQLIARDEVKQREGDVAHHFTQNNRVKTLYVDKETHGLLVKGRLGIVFFDERHWLVPDATAKKILARMPEAVVLLNTRALEPLDEDDPYADFPVPDDLMW